VELNYQSRVIQASKINWAETDRRLPFTGKGDSTTRAGGINIIKEGKSPQASKGGNDDNLHWHATTPHKIPHGDTADIQKGWCDIVADIFGGGIQIFLN